ANESKPPRFASIYDAFDYTVTGSKPVLQSSAPARILAGRAMNLQVGTGTNDMSQILAGGALTVTGGQIDNRALTVDAPTVQSGAAIHSYVQDDRRRYQVAPYDLTTNATVTLAAARREGNVPFAGSDAGTGNLSPGQTGATPQSTGVNPIVQVPAAGSGPLPVVVRTSTPNAGIPAASLFRTHPGPGSRYLVETDPRFANYRNWLSSDYLLDALGSDPHLIQKRLGDGYYEQRLIREQLAQLTGHRDLGGFDSDDAQYAALMNAGVTFARAYGLRPGIALTAAQMAQLTSDIVWLVEQEVTLPDGSTQKVLAPQVYVRVKEGDIDGSGALLAGRQVDLQLAGDLANSGTIAGRQAVKINAQNVHNLAGRITAQDVALTARQDLNVIGGSIDAGNSLAAIAGRDINVVTTTRASTSNANMLPGLDAASGVKLAAVTLDRVAGLYVTNPGGSLLATAGRDMNLVGAEVKSAGDASLSAVRDLNLGSVTTGRAEDIRWSGRNSREGQQSQESGTTVSGAGSVRLEAGRDLTARAATLSAQETLSLEATNRLSLLAGENSTSAETHHATKRGMTKYSLDADSQDTSLARTSLDAKAIQLRSGGNMTLSAIEANAQSMSIDAGGQLDLLTQSTTRATSAREVDNDAAFSSSSGSGRKDETSQYNRFDVKDLSLQAGGGVKAQLGQNDSLTTLAQQPGMAWVNQLVNDPAFVNSVQWQRVKEEHDRWSYHQSGMGPVTALVVSVVAAAVAAPMAAQAGAAAGGAATSAGMGATVSAGASGAVQMGVSAIASRAAVSLANNDGDLGKVLKEMASSESIKAIATSMLTAGVIEGLGASGLLPQNAANATNGSARLTDQLQRQLVNNVAGSVVRSAVNGTSLEDELRHGLVNALLNTAAAQGAFQIGELTSPGIDPVTGAVTPPALNRLAGEVAHAIAGCAVGAGRANVAGGTAGDGCAAGALGAVAGHLTAQFINPTGDKSQALATTEVSRLVGAIAAAIAGGDETAIYVAANAAGNAVENNWLSRKRPSLLGLSEQEQYDAAVKECNAGDKTACDTRNQLAQTSSGRDSALRDACAAGGASTGCVTEVQRAQAAGNTVFVDGRGNIIVNGVAFATAGPITSPFTTSTAGQMTQSATQGAILSPLVLGGVTLYGMGVAAQTTIVSGGLAGLSAGQWATTAGVGGAFSIGTTLFFNPDATPLQLTISGLSGAIGGIIKTGANVSAGLANQWIPTTAGNVNTQLLGTSASRLFTFGAEGVMAGGDSGGSTDQRGNSFWKTPARVRMCRSTNEC
ncbi:DUF637 domain-containing protein, partial [Variovorax sp. JS1663]|uniref:DUF637 domain-containing protein n=1 Tax=Variovorax sp. JS1663 TaxID=1851577 RepID=UPI0018645EDE